MSDKAAAQMVAAELESGAAVDVEPELDLLGEPETEIGRQKRGEIVRRGPGRPPGARNKRDERSLAWLRAHYVDPRERLLAVVSMNTADLAGLLHCSMKEAQEEQRLCAGIVMPFMHQKQPLSVDLNSKTAVYLTIVEGGESRETGILIDATPQALTSEEIQQLKRRPDDKV